MSNRAVTFPLKYPLSLSLRRDAGQEDESRSPVHLRADESPIKLASACVFHVLHTFK